jgi:hypothetical protein
MSEALSKNFNLAVPTITSTAVKITPKAISFSVGSAAGKVYDGTDAVRPEDYVVSFTGYISNPDGGDGTAVVPKSYYSASAVYSDKYAGTNNSRIVVTVTPVNNGYLYRNFTISNNDSTAQSGTVTIAKRPVTFTLTGEGKVYDANTGYVGNLTLTVNNYISESAEEQPTAHYSVVSKGYETKDAGSRRIFTTVSVTGNSYFDKNFSRASDTVWSTETYEIKKAGATVTVSAVSGKVYDGTTTVLSATAYTVSFSGYFTESGNAQPENQFTTSSARYSDKNAGAKSVIVNVAARANSDLNTNFEFSGNQITSGNTVDITKAPLSATARLTASSKEYDGMLKASGGAVTFTGTVPGEGLILNADYTVYAEYAPFEELSSQMAVYVYFKMNANDKTANYSWNEEFKSPEFYAGMTKRPLGVSLTIDAKTYDGTTSVGDAKYTFGFDGIVPHNGGDIKDGGPVEGMDYEIDGLEYLSPNAGENVPVYTNFTLKSDSPYYKYYSVEESFSSKTIYLEGTINKKVITKAEMVDKVVYGMTIGERATAVGLEIDGVLDELTGRLKLSEYNANVLDGEYPVGEYTWTVELELDGWWQVNYSSEEVEVSFEIVPKKIYLSITNPEAFTYDEEDHSYAVLKSVVTGVFDDVSADYLLLDKYLGIKSIKRYENSAVVAAKGEEEREALGKVVFADAYYVYFEVIDPDGDLSNYELVIDDGKDYGTIVINKAPITFTSDRTDNTLTLLNPDKREVYFKLNDGRETTGGIGDLIFAVNNYRTYKIEAVMSGDDAFRYTATVADSKEHELFIVAVALNVAETAGVGLLAYLIYLLVAALKKAQKAQMGFERMKRASDAKRLAAYRSEVKRIQGTKEANSLVKRQGGQAETQNIVKKPKYPTYPDRVDMNVVPRAVPKGYSPVLKNQSIPKQKR